MRKIIITLSAASALALGACQSPQTDQVQDQAETQSDTVDDQAGTMSESPAPDDATGTGGMVEPMGEEKAPVTNDKAAVTPPEAGTSDVPAPADEAKK